MNTWQCDCCERPVSGTGSAENLRAIGWFVFVRGKFDADVIFCPPCTVGAVVERMQKIGKAVDEKGAATLTQPEPEGSAAP